MDTQDVHGTIPPIPLGTKGWDGQVRLRVYSIHMGHPWDIHGTVPPTPPGTVG